MPQPTADHRKLHRLAGTWVGDERLAPSPWGPGGPAKGRISGRVACDGFFVVSDYEEEKDGRVVFCGHSIYGWDPALGAVAWTWVDSMGAPPAAPILGRWDGDALVFVREQPCGASRFTHRFGGDGRYLFTIEGRQGDGPWQVMMEGTYRRTSP